MSLPYVPFYTSDFLAGTSGMTAATKGVYITLLCLMYEAEGPLPQKWDTLARRCGCTLPAFKRALSDLQDDGKIESSDEGLWSEKCDKHITQRRERSDSARAAANKRWEKTQQKQGEANADASNAQCQPEPEPEPLRDTYVSPAITRSKPLRFEEFWEMYPHRGGAKKDRKAALQKYSAAIKRGVPEDEIIQGAIRYQKDRQVIEGFGKGPVPWLNRECWADEIETAQLKAIAGGKAAQLGRWEKMGR